MVIDKLLHGMDVNPNNLKLTGLGVGCSAHPDDIRTCCIGAEALNRQAADINRSISSNSLKAGHFSPWGPLTSSRGHVIH